MNSKEKDLKLLLLAMHRLSLMFHLHESYPEISGDAAFVIARCDLAAEAYEKAIKAGYSSFEATELEQEVLFQDLHFSKHDTLVNILWNEFSDVVPQGTAKSLAIKLLPECEMVFAKYPLSDDFAYEPEFELLYTELTGTIAIYFEEHELQ
ncbi:hypothetical protein Barb7_00800 [Bacteroidales bacterium Barb7]|nr:hypothetical protein Barb7_00800 [Bacteroidales bacterium Barb7]